MDPKGCLGCGGLIFLVVLLGYFGLAACGSDSEPESLNDYSTSECEALRLVALSNENSEWSRGSAAGEYEAHC